jgi:hypothetical protein
MRIQICEALVLLLEHYVTWPPTEQLAASSFKLPFSVGAIDGSHVEIKQPLGQLEAYTNRKGYTSVVLQGVCDSGMKFLDISTGWPGSMHDARIFRLSSLCAKLEESGIGPYHLLGDSAYPLKSYLIVPFRDNGHLTPEETHFNIIHSSSRNVIERSFARLKGKFRRLKYLDMDNLSLVSVVITAACVLHNAILFHEWDTVDNDLDDIPDNDDMLDEFASFQEDCNQRRQELLHML